MTETGALQAALPDYEVTTELGRGAMGIVYLGTHRALGRTVAIKELPASFAIDGTVRERFLAEARVVARLDHPHIVVIHDFVDRDGHLALVMEHLPNGTVWDQFLHHGLAAPRACGLTLATLAGLHHAHERGVMHRDIKPENLIFTHDWQLKVTDFGIAQVLTGDSTMGTEEGAIVGTPAYMSPEQARGQTCGPPADVYASGAMLYEMLTGALPFPDASSAMQMALARLSTDPIPIGEVGPTVPPSIAEATMRALTRNEGDRYQSAEEFGVALAQASAFAWGPEWMAESGTAVRGSQAIEQAARTTDRRSVTFADAVPDPGPDVEVPGDAAATPATDVPAPTILEGTDDATPAPAEPTTPAVEPPGADRAVSDDRHTRPAPDQAALPSEPTASGAAAPVVFDQIPTAPVVPQQRERIAGANLNHLAPADIINLKQARRPGSPLAFAVAAVICLGLAAVFALAGVGDDPIAAGADSVRVEGRTVAGTDPVEADLTEPFAMVVPVDDLSATFLGIPIGSATIEDDRFDPAYLRFTGAGVVELGGTLADGRELTFPVRATNSPYPTAPFVLAVMIGLGALASVQSNLRGLRSRRIRVSPFVGLVMSGAIAGAAGAVIAMLMVDAPAAVASVVTVAAFSAAGCALLGEAYRRWYRRRRLRHLAIPQIRR